MSASFDLAGFLAEPGRMAQVAAVSPGGVPLLGSVWFLYADGRFWFSSHPSTPSGAAAVDAFLDAGSALAGADLRYAADRQHGRPDGGEGEVSGGPGRRRRGRGSR